MHHSPPNHRLPPPARIARLPHYTTTLPLQKNTTPMAECRKTIHDHTIDAHLGMKLSVWYADDPCKAAICIDELEEDLTMERYKVVGLDIEYTRDHAMVAVVQFCVGQKVLLYHFSRAVGRCQRLEEFLSSEKYTFTTVDTANNKKVLKNSGL